MVKLIKYRIKRANRLRLKDFLKPNNLTFYHDIPRQARDIVLPRTEVFVNKVLGTEVSLLKDDTGILTLTFENLTQLCILLN